MLYTVLQDAFVYSHFGGPYTVAARHTLEAAEARAKELADQRCREWQETHPGERVEVRPMIEDDFEGEKGEQYAWGVYTDDKIGEMRLIYTYSTDTLEDVG